MSRRSIELENGLRMVRRPFSIGRVLGLGESLESDQ
jgi:hypothetical protein